MNTGKLNIRQEIPADYSAVKSLIQAAFAAVEYSDQSEHLLVERLRKSASFVPELSLVSEWDNQVVGHILLTPISIKGETLSTPSLALAPVSVAPEWQGRGIGGVLIKAAHDRARELGHQSVILLGHAAYYPRFGYRPTHEYGIQLPFPAPLENCMVLELEQGTLAGVNGMVEYPPEFME